MKGLIIAAGRGSRLSHISDLKPLTLLDDIPLLEHVMLSAVKGGVDGFVVVTGYRSQDLLRFLDEVRSRRNLEIEVLHNGEWEKSNGLSVLKAKGHLQEKFVLLMADHVFDPAIVADLREIPLNRGEVVLAVDTRVDHNELIDLEDVTRVQCNNGRIVRIGKSLEDFDAFDTGMFLCTPAIFPALEQSIQAGDSSLSGGIQALADRGKAKVMDIGARLWVDVDDEPALYKAFRVIRGLPLGF
jgi:choline kinase